MRSRLIYRESGAGTAAENFQRAVNHGQLVAAANHWFFLSNCASNTIALEGKSALRTNAADSVAP